MRVAKVEIVWFLAVVAFVGYLIGDIFAFWDTQPIVVLLSSCVLIFAGRNLGKTKGFDHG